MTTRPRILLAAVAIAALSLIVYKAGNFGAHTDASGDGALEARVGKIEAQQQEILDLLRPGSSGRFSSASPGDAMAIAGQPQGQQAPLPDPRQGDIEFKQLQAAHAHEKVDPAWAPAAERQLTSASQSFANAGIQPKDMDLGCRSQSCELTAHFAKHGDAEDWSLMFITQSAPTVAQARQMIVEMPDGSFELRVLGSRR